MLRVIVGLLLLLSSAAYSEDGSPRESENKSEATQQSQAPSQSFEGSPIRFPFVIERPAPPVVQIYTKAHADEPSHCAGPKDWKEWGSFSWCRSLEWLDAE